RKEAPRIVERVFTLSRPSAPQKRFCAKGRSAEMQRTTALSSLLASSLKRRTDAAQTPVSRLGKMLSTFRLPAKLASVTSERSLATREKGLACSPTAAK